MVDRPPTDKELTSILAQFRRAGRGQLMTSGALDKLAAEIGLEAAEPESTAPAKPDSNSDAD